ncbi:MAG: hypothetical protein ABI321_21490 [Polyangia bacterium]
MADVSLLRALAVFVVCALGGCIPVRDTLRPAIHGQVLDDHGQGVAHARVQACVRARFNRGRCSTCETQLTDGEGNFQFARCTEWHMLPGEAPMQTIQIVACDAAGKMAVADGAPPPGEALSLTLATDAAAPHPDCPP